MVIIKCGAIKGGNKYYAKNIININAEVRSKAPITLSLSRKRKLTRITTGLLSLAVIVAGGFLVMQQQTNTAQATVYEGVIFSDNFDRYNNDGSNNIRLSNHGNNYVFPGYHGDGVTGIDGWRYTAVNRVRGGGTNWGGSAMLYKDNVADGKITVDIDTTYFSAGRTNALLARTTDAGASIMGTISHSGNDYTIGLLNTSDGSFGDYNLRVAGSGVVSTGTTTGTSLRVELSVVGFVAEITLLDLTNSNNVVATASKTFSADSVQMIGKWGITGSVNDGADFDNLVIEQSDQDFRVVSTGDNVKIGDTITYTIADDEDRTISNFSDGGAGGSFSPNSVELNSGNNYTATVTYTPAGLGQYTITADVSGGETFERQIGVWPYSTKIGFIGDSITAGVLSAPGLPACDVAMNELGDGFKCINVGIGSTRIDDYANDYYNYANLPDHTQFPNGTPILTNVITTLKAQDVDIVHIMLGANGHNDKASYVAGMQRIIDRLKDEGFRQVIISEALYSTSANPQQLANLQAQGEAIAELAAANHGYVLVGDTQGYEQFTANASSWLADNVHPNTAGHIALGAFWANAILADLDYQINPDKTWSNSDNEFTLDETGTLTLSIDKYFGEFASIVSVDGNVLNDSSDYTATAGSTVIELSNAYLNSLAVGNHTITVAFNGGVSVSSQFTILARGTNPTNPTNPIVPGVPNTGLFRR